MKRQQTYAEMWRDLTGGQQQAIAEKLARAQGAENLENVFKAVLKGEMRIRLEDATKTYVVVPDLSPAGLVALAQEKIGLASIDPSFATWDFSQYRVAEGQPARIFEVRGKRYEVLLWKPGEHVTTQQVRDHFKALGADGNTAAFVAWMTELEPWGTYITIPSDDALLFQDKTGDFNAPVFGHDGTGHTLTLYCVQFGWDDRWVFVAFREIP